MQSLKISKYRLTALLLIGFVWGLPLQTASAGDIYKWVDETGVTHYSNKKPAGVKWKLMPEAKLSVIPGERIGAEAARAARTAPVQTEPGAASPSTDQTALEERRDRLLQDCHVNNGVDCKREVDTQLRSEQIQQGAPVIHLAPRRSGSALR
jgi:hypothetical protein